MTGALEALANWVRENLSWLLPALVAVVGGVWAYAKFIVERSILPASEFDIELHEVGAQDESLVLEIVATLENRGSTSLVVQNLWIDVLYLLEGDPVELWDSPSKDPKRCGRVDFRRKLRGRLDKEAVAAAREDAFGVWEKSNEALSDPARRLEAGGRDASRREPRGLPVAPHRTFVSAGVMQRYTYVTALPADASFVLVHAAFYYEPGGSPLQHLAWRVLQGLGLVSHSLRHVREPHTCERVFKLQGAGEEARLQGEGRGRLGGGTSETARN